MKEKIVIKKNSDYYQTYPIGSVLQIGQRKYEVMEEPEFVEGCKVCSFRKGLCKLLCMSSERKDKKDVYFREI